MRAQRRPNGPRMLRSSCARSYTSARLPVACCRIDAANPINGDGVRLGRSTQLRMWRGCCRNSSSSGYLSHSPLWVTSVSVYCKPIGWAVIREGEVIPRSIWHSLTNIAAVVREVNNHRPGTEYMREQARDTSIYNSTASCPNCSCSSSISYSDNSDYRQTISAIANKELLLELSGSARAVLEGGSAQIDKEILRDISVYSVSHRAPIQPAVIYEEIYVNEVATAVLTPTVALLNPINSTFYQHRYSGSKNVLWQSQLLLSSNQQVIVNPNPRSSGPTVFLLPANRVRTKSVSRLTHENMTSEKLSSKQILKKSFHNQNHSRVGNDVRFNYSSITQHEYTTLECSDGSSSESDAVLKGSTWKSDFRGFDKNLDFTLDGFKAERLGRTIANAKRRRQWCRVVVVIFGLVFFILSVVIVSLSMTKGRKVFGSM